jgi:hypothetical protein
MRFSTRRKASAQAHACVDWWSISFAIVPYPGNSTRLDERALGL